MNDELCYQQTTKLTGDLIACQLEKGHGGTHATQNMFWTDSFEQVQAENSSLCAELTEAKAQLEEFVVEKMPANTIVEAATALTAHFRLGFLIGSDEEMAKWQSAHDALCHRLLAAVEEGNRT